MALEIAARPAKVDLSFPTMFTRRYTFFELVGKEKLGKGSCSSNQHNEVEVGFEPTTL